MTIMHFSSVIAVAGSSLGDLAPTVTGRIVSSDYTTQYVVEARGQDEDVTDPYNATGTGEGRIFIIKTATDTFVRVTAQSTGSNYAYERWYNGAGANQGDPGNTASAGTTVFQLNAVADTVNIYTAASTSSGTGTTDFNAVGTYTNDDKTTFFNPTQDVKYGLEVDCQATYSSFDTPGSKFALGRFNLQITFKKDGYNDYTVNFSAYGRGEAIGGF